MAEWKDSFDEFDDEDDFEEIGGDDELEDFIDDDDDEDEFDDFDDGGLDLYGAVGADGLDVPDVPDIVRDLISRGAADAIEDIYGAIADHPESQESRRRILAVESIFETESRESIPGMSRSLLSLGRVNNKSFGTGICQTLVADLRRYQERLLFGLTENLYLHCSRSITYVNDRICASLRVFWDEEPSPYRLIVMNAADITENTDLVYLLVGDLLEDMLNGIEEATEGRTSSDGCCRGDGRCNSGNGDAGK